jgi:hypothetical protein
MLDKLRRWTFLLVMVLPVLGVGYIVAVAAGLRG